MNLLQLRYFCDTAQSQSIAKTAEKHMVPASCVSASIKRLEIELGTNLFDRSSNKLILNAKGKLFANELQIAFDRIDGAQKKLETLDKEIPQIRLLVRARPKWIAELIIEYRTLNPEVNFIVSNDYTLKNIDDYDIVIDEQQDKYNGWKNFLLSVEMLCIKAASHSKLGGRELTFEQLKEEVFILPSRGNGMRNRYELLCKEKGITPKVAIECNDRQLLQYYVQSGIGLTIGAYRALNDNTQNAICPLTVVDFNETQNVYVFYKNYENKNLALKDFCDFLYTKKYI